MAEMPNRQRNLLILLALVLAVLGYRRIGGLFGSGGEGFLGSRRTADFSDVLKTEVESLEIARLQAEPRELEVGRNPWRYGALPPSPPPPRVEPVRRDPPPVVVPVETGPVAPPKPQPPPVDIEFLGSFGPDRRKIAVFSSGKSVTNALVGDVINSKFRVHAIGLESVDITFEGFPDVEAKRLPIKSRK